MNLDTAKEFSSLHRIYDEDDKIFLVIDYVKGKTLKVKLKEATWTEEMSMQTMVFLLLSIH
jgi:hypothetical protein